MKYKEELKKYEEEFKKYEAKVKVIKSRLLKIMYETPKRDKTFFWYGKGYYNLIYGIHFQYHSSRDLTASVWENWYDHQIGDTPKFHLGDVIKAMGDLWDSSLINEVSLNLE